MSPVLPGRERLLRKARWPELGECPRIRTLRNGGATNVTVFLCAEATAGSGGMEVVSITCTDNYVTLFPRESITITDGAGAADWSLRPPDSVSFFACCGGAIRRQSGIRVGLWGLAAYSGMLRHASGTNRCSPPRRVQMGNGVLCPPRLALKSSTDACPPLGRKSYQR